MIFLQASKTAQAPLAVPAGDCAAVTVVAVAHVIYQVFAWPGWTAPAGSVSHLFCLLYEPFINRVVPDSGEITVDHIAHGSFFHMDLLVVDMTVIGMPQKMAGHYISFC